MVMGVMMMGMRRRSAVMTACLLICGAATYATGQGMLALAQPDAVMAEIDAELAAVLNKSRNGGDFLVAHLLRCRTRRCRGSAARGTPPRASGPPVTCNVQRATCNL